MSTKMHHFVWESESESTAIPYRLPKLNTVTNESIFRVERLSRLTPQMMLAEGHRYSALPQPHPQFHHAMIHPTPTQSTSSPISCANKRPHSKREQKPKYLGEDMNNRSTSQSPANNYYHKVRPTTSVHCSRDFPVTCKPPDDWLRMKSGRMK